MVHWDRFYPRGFEYDFEHDELAANGVTFKEAVDCLLGERYVLRRNRGPKKRYQLLGRTAGGRHLKIIFEIRPGNIVRIITEWPI